MNPRSVPCGQNHTTRRSEAKPLWTTYVEVWLREDGEGVQDPVVLTDLDTLITAPYVKIDDCLPRRRRLGGPPRLSDAELITLAVAQALLGITSEARWLRIAATRLAGAFPFLPGQPAYNRRLRAAGPLIRRAIRLLARDTDLWHDDVWLADSTAVECARSRETVKRSDLAGWAAYGYSASHSRYFWGLRLHLLCTPAGLPVSFALASPKADEREVLRELLATDADLVAGRHGQTIIADKGYVSSDLDHCLHQQGLRLLRPSYRNRRPRPGQELLKPVRQLIESVNDTLKGHPSRGPPGE